VPVAAAGIIGSRTETLSVLRRAHAATNPPARCDWSQPAAHHSVAGPQQRFQNHPPRAAISASNSPSPAIFFRWSASIAAAPSLSRRSLSCCTWGAQKARH